MLDSPENIQIGPMITRGTHWKLSMPQPESNSVVQ
jgi:hypothetical protein